MKIRNDHPVARLLPTQHSHAEPGEEIPWPDDVSVPDGFTVTEGPPAPPANPTRAQLLEIAMSLEIQVPARAKRDDIAALIKAATETTNPTPDDLDGDQTTDTQEQ